MSKTRVLIVDDHAVLRSGLRMLINSQPDLEVVGEAGSLAEAIDRAAASKPDVVTLDLSMPGSSGIGGVSRLRQAVPGARLLVLTMHDDPAYVRSAMAMGAVGYVVKSAADSELIGAIRAVSRGGVFVDVQNASLGGASLPVQGRQKAGTPLDALSAREREVFTEVAKGYTNQQIADRSGLSVKTVESYRARLMSKLGLKSRADLTRLALDAGVLDKTLSDSGVGPHPAP